MSAENRAGLSRSIHKVSRVLGRFYRHDHWNVEQDTIRFLHIGKAAGTQISNVIDQVNAAEGRKVLVKMGHRTRLKNIPSTAPYFFSIRWPVSRFKSGFYSRKRCGRPRIYAPWTQDETEAFTRFEHANDLAEALFEPGQTHQDATAAILSIKHPAMNQVSWFEKQGAFLSLRPPVWIVRQEQFETDLRVFLQKIGHEHTVSIVDDPVMRHANNYENTPPLSEKAIENLKRWYAQDIAFYDMCSNWLESRAERRAAMQETRQPYASGGHL